MKAEKLPLGFWLCWILGMAWCLYRALMNEAWIQDDEVSHFLISHNVWSNPKELWHSWSRPGRNLLQCVPAYFGIEAARLWTLSLAGFTVWLAGREALSLRLTILWMLPLLIFFQWWFPELSYPVLTQTPFMMVWFLAVYLARRGHLAWAAICWGYLPLTRHEGILLSGLWGLWVIFGPSGFARYALERKWREMRPALLRAAWLGFLTLLPLALMNVMAYVTRQQLPLMRLFESKPTDYYGSGPIWLYLAHLFYGAGVPVVIFLVWGMTRQWKIKDWSLLLYWTYPAYLVMHSLIYWKGLFASGGYYHFIMPMAPWIGLVALKGIEAIRERWGPVPVRIAAVLTVYGGLLMLQQQFVVRDGGTNGMPKVSKKINWLAAPPMAPTRFEKGLKNAAIWLEENLKDEPWLSHHIVIKYHLHQSDLKNKLSPWKHRGPTTNNLPKGTILAWDSQYSVDSFGFTPDVLHQNGWKELERWAHGTVRIYRKD